MEMNVQDQPTFDPLFACEKCPNQVSLSLIWLQEIGDRYVLDQATLDPLFALESHPDQASLDLEECKTNVQI